MFMEATRNVTGLRWEDTAESRVSPPPISFISSAAVQDALDLGKLKEGDTYSFYDNNGNLMRGTVTVPGAPKKKEQPAPVAPAPMQPAPTAPEAEPSTPMQPGTAPTPEPQAELETIRQPQQADVGEPETFTTPVSRFSTVPGSAPVEGQVPGEAPLETVPGELPPGDEGEFGPLSPGVPELETEAEPEMKLPPLPEAKQMSARERRLQLIALKPIVDKLKNKKLTDGKSEVTIRGYKTKGVAVVRDGKPMIMTWDDFEELMDKLGYLK
jgi:hypothetical protein